MVLKDIYKRIIAIITLCIFLLSTSGMILFYHYCQHANEFVFSMYIDSTEELCEENAKMLHMLNHDDSHCCCQHHGHQKDCCENHQSNSKTLKLKDDFNFAERQTTPKPVLITLLLPEAFDQIDIFHTLLIKYNLPKEIPPETPINLPTGKEWVTSHHSLKIAC